MQIELASFVSFEGRHFKRLPQCEACEQRFTEQEFQNLEGTGHNIIWNIDYAICSDCGGEVQGWLA